MLQALRLGSVVVLLLATAVACRSREQPDAPPPDAPPPPSGSAAARAVADPEGFAAVATDRDTSQAAVAADGPLYAWQQFLWLSQPLAEPGAKVWETTFRQTSTIFLPDGSAPAPWGQEAVPETVTATTPEGCSASSDVWHNLDTAIQVDGLALLDVFGQDVRYQLLMNRPAFDYVVARGFYNVDGQEQAARDNKPADFPWQSYELKTSWIWLGQDAERCAKLEGSYYIVKAFYQTVDDDGIPTGYDIGYAALAGLHIINRSLPNWVWITFENIHNATYTQARLALPIPPDVQAANAAFQAALRRIGSVFANYQLDGIQTTFTEPDDPTVPVLLANSTIESAFQSQSSCSTCHALASIKPDGEYFNLVDSSGGNIAYYIGDPPDVEAQGFTSLDFVWSLKRAHRARTGG